MHTDVLKFKEVIKCRTSTIAAISFARHLPPEIMSSPLELPLEKSFITVTIYLQVLVELVGPVELVEPVVLDLLGQVLVK